MIILSKEHRDKWLEHPTDSKRDMLRKQRVFMHYNKDHRKNCMCTVVTRKLFFVKFNEWYAKIGN